MTAPLTILIAGPTASGKSSLALRLAETTGGLIVNADALQVYDNWRILTARPSPEDESRADHVLYGHITRTESYSVGHWLRDLETLFAAHPDRARIIVGGTGLYFTSLTRGLAEIPEIDPETRAEGDRIRETDPGVFLEELRHLDPQILETMDKSNPVRLQRAWEVARATDRPLSDWQRDTPAPLLAETDCLCLTVACDRAALWPRIDRRFDWMIANGAIEECEAELAQGWLPELPSARALGAAEIIASLEGKMPLTEAVERAKIATRQYAKRQRTWLRSKMTTWTAVQADTNAETILESGDYWRNLT